MRVPDVSLYKNEDFDEVVALVDSEGYLPPRYREELLNGLGLVARDERHVDHGVIGFVWALAARGNPVAYLDYFVVKSEFSGTNVGLWLLGTVSVMLREFGVRKMVGNVPSGNHAYLRMIVRKGGRDLGLHHLVEMDLGREADHGQEDGNDDQAGAGALSHARSSD